MTNENTNEEWLKVIEKVEKGVPTNFTEYKAPGLGTPGFAKCIDHTLLKLDATKHQIEELCEQAREYNFKVSRDHLLPPYHGRCQLHVYLVDPCFLVLCHDRDATSHMLQRHYPVRWQGVDATVWRNKNQTFCILPTF